MKRSVIAVLCIILLMGLSGCKKVQEIQPDQDNATDPGSGYRRTTLYYMTKDGFVVPVMKSIPWEEGIGKAALGYLRSSQDNDRSAAAMGLETVIPEGTEFTLRISDDGVATVDMMSLTQHDTPQQENAMVVSIVNTLGEFDSIDSVKLTVDGKTQKTLPHGTDISNIMQPFALNVEEGDIEVSTGTANAMTLYFPNSSASLNVPVTRYVSSSPSFATAMAELISGSEDQRLLDCFPEGTELNSAYISDGVACVDMSEEFAGIENVEGMLEAARDSIFLTANNFEEVSGVDIYINGKEYSMQAQDISTPVYVNEFR